MSQQDVGIVLQSLEIQWKFSRVASCIFCKITGSPVCPFKNVIAYLTKLPKPQLERDLLCCWNQPPQSAQPRDAPFFEHMQIFESITFRNILCLLTLFQTTNVGLRCGAVPPHRLQHSLILTTFFTSLWFIGKIPKHTFHANNLLFVGNFQIPDFSSKISYYPCQKMRVESAENVMSLVV